jgi:hypothetical protein
MKRGILIATAGALLLSLSACEKEATPPAADAKLCESTMASWWFDATGAGGLTGVKTGILPLTNPTQQDGSYKTAECRVMSDAKEVASFRAELASKEAAANWHASLKRYPEAGKFTVAGGTGGVEPNTGEDVGRAWWACKTTVLRVELYKPKDKKARDDLVKALAQHIAGVTGCPGPDAS